MAQRQIRQPPRPERDQQQPHNLGQSVAAIMKPSADAEHHRRGAKRHEQMGREPRQYRRQHWEAIRGATSRFSIGILTARFVIADGCGHWGFCFAAFFVLVLSRRRYSYAYSSLSVQKLESESESRLRLSTSTRAAAGSDLC